MQMERIVIEDGLKALGAILLMTIVNVYVPFLSLLILVIWPVPVVYIAVKHEMREAAVVITIAAILNGLFFGPLMGLITIIGFGFVGFVIGGSLKEGFSPFKTLLLTVAGVLISQGLIIIISRYIVGFNVNNFINGLVDYVNQSQELSDFKDILEAQVQLVKMIYPAIIIVSSIVTGIFNYYISLWYLNNTGFDRPVYLPMRFWHFPRWIISLGIVISLLLKTNPVFVNLNIILFFLTFMQGFAVGLYYIDRTRNTVFLRWIYIFLIVFIPPVPILLTLTGLVDMWFDLRRLDNGNEENPS